MKFLNILLLTIVITKCASLPEENAPFKVLKAVHNTTDKATVLELMLDNTSNIVFDRMYYQNKVAEAVVKENSVFGNFTKPKLDIQLHGDSKKEFGNKPLIKNVKPPFEIKENEAILSYKIGDETKYIKVKNIEKK